MLHFFLLLLTFLSWYETITHTGFSFNWKAFKLLFYLHLLKLFLV